MRLAMATGLGQAPAVSTIASTIQQVEGYSGPSTQYPNGTLAYQNNNPGNLVYNSSSTGQISNGATPGINGFASFPSYQAGYNALLSQIQTYANQGLTIDQMMAKYAPATDANGNPTGNNPTAYAQQIATTLGVSTDTTVADAIGANSGASPGVDLTGNSIDTLDTTTDDGSIDPTTLLALLIGAAAVIYFA